MLRVERRCDLLWGCCQQWWRDKTKENGRKGALETIDFCSQLDALQHIFLKGFIYPLVFQVKASEPSRIVDGEQKGDKGRVNTMLYKGQVISFLVAKRISWDYLLDQFFRIGSPALKKVGRWFDRCERLDGCKHASDWFKQLLEALSSNPGGLKTHRQIWSNPWNNQLQQVSMIAQIGSLFGLEMITMFSESKIVELTMMYDVVSYVLRTLVHRYSGSVSER